jgi:hypothetical protein
VAAAGERGGGHDELNTAVSAAAIVALAPRARMPDYC